MAAEKGVGAGRVLYGIHPVEEALRSGRPVEALHLAERARGSRLRALEELARSRGVAVRRLDSRALHRLAGGGVHQGVVAEVAARSAVGLDDVLAGLAGRKEALLVVLDGVQDPHNLGAVVRNAALTGAAAVLIPKDRSASVTPVVEKVAPGALEHVPVVRVGNVAQVLRRLKEDRGLLGLRRGRRPGGGGLRHDRLLGAPRPRPRRGALLLRMILWTEPFLLTSIFIFPTPSL